MNRGLAIALLLASAIAPLGAGSASAQMGQPAMPQQCTKFPALSQATQVKANAVSAAMKAKADRKDICRLMTAFVASEDLVVKFLIENKTWCGVPDEAVVAAKTNHEKSVKFRNSACAEAPAPKAPTLSDAIKTPAVNSADQYQGRPRRHFRYADR